jgi:hypothetical protein
MALSYQEFVVALSVFITLTGCDKIDDPVIPITTNYQEALYGPHPVFETVSTPVQHVLVEDFTAHQCGNCPAAAFLAADIAEANEGLVHVMAIHAGNLAATDDNHFDTDWTTPEGNVFWDQLDFQANPMGRVNRQNGTGAFLLPAEWEEATAIALAEAPALHLQMTAEAVAGSDHVNLHINGQFFEDVAGPLKLAVLILESNIVDYQLDYDSDPPVVEHYVFDHMLRGSVNGATGLGFADAASGAANGLNTTKSFTYTWEPGQGDLAETTWLAVVSNAAGEVVNVAAAHAE